MENDIVMAMTRPIISGGIKIAVLGKDDAPCLLNQRVGRFEGGESIDHKYLYYSVFSQRVVSSIMDIAAGSSQPNMSSRDVERIIVALPPIYEQIRIASILSEVDAKIEIERAFKVGLEQLKKGLMQVLLTGKVRVKV